MRRIHTVSLAALVGLSLSLAISPLAAQTNCGNAGVVRVGVAPPPPLPETSQPPMPAYGDVWTPGYWAWNTGLNDYYWVDGVWAVPPAIGLLWTPGYWAWNGGVYAFNPGYWGPTVGFYGGVRYGFGYWGRGYDGGYWLGRTLYYNRFYNNIGALRINALYERRVAGDRLVGRVSYVGGPGGVVAAPTAAEIAAAREAHFAPTAVQVRHIQAAAADPALRAGVNHGRPPLAFAASRAAPPVATAAPVHAVHPGAPAMHHVAPATHSFAPGEQHHGNTPAYHADYQPAPSPYYRSTVQSHPQVVRAPSYAPARPYSYSPPPHAYSPPAYAGHPDHPYNPPHPEHPDRGPGPH